MTTEALQKLDAFRVKLSEQERENIAEFKLLSSKCEYRKDNSNRHGMYAQIPVCRASGIHTLKACDITTCPAIH